MIFIEVIVCPYYYCTLIVSPYLKDKPNFVTTLRNVASKLSTVGSHDVGLRLKGARRLPHVGSTT